MHAVNRDHILHLGSLPTKNETMHGCMATLANSKKRAGILQGFIYWGVRGGIFPPKIFIVKLNNNCIKYF